MASTPLLFGEKRHLISRDELAAYEEALSRFGQQVRVDWRIARLKTVGIGLLLALNIGVDPPDVFRCMPCARLERWHGCACAVRFLTARPSWIDPTLAPAAVSAENIARALQAQYEPWQARARVRIVIKPTNDELKRLCLTLRRHAKVRRATRGVASVCLIRFRFRATGF
jgi:hypothetical protein